MCEKFVTKSIFDKLSCKKKMIVFPQMSHALMSENLDDILPDVIDWLHDIYRVSKN